jgi:hypothetical protein
MPSSFSLEELQVADCERIQPSQLFPEHNQTCVPSCCHQILISFEDT